jgi:catechol 2,3-dioxygenase-like lactoylglutathione lyase family enzyme
MPRAHARSTDGAAELLQKAGAEGEGHVDVLGPRLVADEAFALVLDSGGVAVRVQKVAKIAPSSYTVLGWSVPDIEAAMERLRTSGVRSSHSVSRGRTRPACGPLATERAVAWFKDPDGNLLSLRQR